MPIILSEGTHVCHGGELAGRLGALAVQNKILRILRSRMKCLDEMKRPYARDETYTWNFEAQRR